MMNIAGMVTCPYIIILVDAPKDTKANDVLMIDGLYADDLVSNETSRLSWMSGIVYKGKKPARDAAKKTTMVVAMTDAAENGIGVPAVLIGIAVVEVDIKNKEDRFVTIGGTSSSSSDVVSSPQEGFAVRLTPVPGTGDTGKTWCTIRIPAGGGSLFPVKLTKKGGNAGDANGPCSFTYTLATYPNEVTIESDQVADDNDQVLMQRWPIGKMKEAKIGLATVNKDGKIVLVWCDETPDFKKCPDK